jgi:hypothetical protein
MRDLRFGAERTAMILFDAFKPITTSGPFDKESPVFTFSFLAHCRRPMIWILDTYFGTDMVPQTEIIVYIFMMS